ncbi:MAG: hypothetical protein ACRD2T_03985 [Thermoanaerobaculia bacterium]
MRRHPLAALALGLVLAAPLRLPAQPQPPSPSTSRPQLQGLAPELRELVIVWLHRDCGAAEKTVLADRLVAVGSRLEPVFWEAYRLGPPAGELESDRGAIAARYRERQAWLEDSGARLMGPEETRRLLAVSPEQYVRRELNQAVQAYRSAALAGLGLVGTQK